MNDSPSYVQPILEEDLHAYVDNLLGAPRRRELQEYLADHPDVAHEIAAYAAQRSDLRDALAPVAEEPLPPSLNFRRLIAEHKHDKKPKTWPWGMAAAVLLSLGVGIGTGWSLRGGSEAGDAGISALAREVTHSYDVYASDVTRPVEMGPSQRTELVSWVSQRLGRKVAVPDLAPLGYRFMGGRLVATEHGPAGLFLYDNVNGVRIALMIRPMSVEQNTAAMRTIDGPHAGYAWADQGLGYGVVGDSTRELLHPLADEMRRQVGTYLKG
jgi:anti-sigma factor RsiW